MVFKVFQTLLFFFLYFFSLNPLSATFGEFPLSPLFETVLILILLLVQAWHAPRILGFLWHMKNFSICSSARGSLVLIAATDLRN